MASYKFTDGIAVRNDELEALAEPDLALCFRKIQTPAFLEEDDIFATFHISLPFSAARSAASREIARQRHRHEGCRGCAGERPTCGSHLRLLATMMHLVEEGAAGRSSAPKDASIHALDGLITCQARGGAMDGGGPEGSGERADR
jgi:hypothetical protein